MSVAVLGSVAVMQLERDGTMRVALWDGRIVSAPLGRDAFEPSSLIASFLQLSTTRRCGRRAED